MLILCYEKAAYTVIVDNSTNNNTFNNYLTLQNIEQKITLWHMPVENQVLAWDRYKKVAGLNDCCFSDFHDKNMFTNNRWCR
jgi:hypothetical protein